MSIYVPSQREIIQELREENFEMQKEIDNLVKQRDEAMDKADENADSFHRAMRCADYWETCCTELQKIVDKLSKKE